MFHAASSLYNSIALDIAQRIVNGEFVPGSKLSGRSLLASQYNVSPETIRKAIALLKGSNVVDVSQGKEVKVVSEDQAYHFIEHHKSLESVCSLKQELELLLEHKREIDQKFEHVLWDIINHTDRLRNLTPYNPVEIRVPSDSHVVGKTIAEVRLWQHTGATVVAIRRGMEIIISPGPQAMIQASDRVVVVGKEGIYNEVTEFFQMPLHK